MIHINALHPRSPTACAPPPPSTPPSACGAPAGAAGTEQPRRLVSAHSGGGTGLLGGEPELGTGFSTRRPVHSVNQLAASLRIPK
jgi:hypothetical protein